MSLVALRRELKLPVEARENASRRELSELMIEVTQYY
jgi:hypothetical protein